MLECRFNKTKHHKGIASMLESTYRPGTLTMLECRFNKTTHHGIALLACTYRPGCPVACLKCIQTVERSKLKLRIQIGMPPLNGRNPISPRGFPGMDIRDFTPEEQERKECGGSQVRRKVYEHDSQRHVATACTSFSK